MQGARSQLAFLFSLVNPFGVGPVRIPDEKNGSGCVIVCNSNKGPTFRQDLSVPYSYLQISNNANACGSPLSYSRLHGRFSCPEGKPGDLFLTGSKRFIVDDYEVFQLY